MTLKDQTQIRQKALKDLIATHLISDQMRLVDLLKEHYQIETNQAVVSRDLRKLGIVKKMLQGVLAYEVPNLDVAKEILKLGLVDILHNETTIVIKTQPGLADFVGDCIDRQVDLDILGSLAGENVVFVAPKSIKNIHDTYKKLCEKLGFKKEL